MLAYSVIPSRPATGHSFAASQLGFWWRRCWCGCRLGGDFCAQVFTHAFNTGGQCVHHRQALLVGEPAPLGDFSPRAPTAPALATALVQIAHLNAGRNDWRFSHGGVTRQWWRHVSVLLIAFLAAVEAGLRLLGRCLGVRCLGVSTQLCAGGVREVLEDTNNRLPTHEVAANSFRSWRPSLPRRCVPVGIGVFAG